MLRRGPHGRFMLYDIVCKIHDPLFDVAFQDKTPLFGAFGVTPSYYLYMPVLTCSELN